jgi:uncharacterized protein YaaR (DUF327 family)
MKIASSNQHSLNKNTTIKPEHSKSNEISQLKQAPTSFAETVKTNILKETNTAFTELISKISETGKAFVKQPQEESLNLYKESIKLFLGELKRNFLSLKEEFGANRNGEQKVYQIVNSIEAEVAALTKETLNENVATELLCSLDDVRGLVIDIIG